MLIPYSKRTLLSPYLGQFERDIGRVFNSLIDEDSCSTECWTPAVDISEEEDFYLVVADIPGVDPKEIEITAEDGNLSIRGHRTKESKAEEGNFRRAERFSGSFLRNFALPEQADVDNITASGKNGVLELRIPKKESTKPRRIEVA